ncbi:hypothetical protein [Microbacterium sp. LMC-P-041]|uniref:hypothetical protein n=1 Tax=Microbacterium sp. LMC-P-041 TaxID=3040293 RepID=UPI002555B669|nr:hypothetical protein [Microbacterium sp. LMC-P-041]
MTPEPIVNVLSPTDLESRRRELLSSVGFSLYDLRDRAHEYVLSIDELEVLRELERLEFLSGN